MNANLISLEPLTAAHADELFSALAHPAIYTYISDKPPASISALAERYRRLESRFSPDGSQQWLNWAIRSIKHQRCIGYIQATVYPTSTADFAFVLAPPFWGLGLARIASVTALSYLFTKFSVTYVFATVDRRNLRSSALLLRLSFERVTPASYPHGPTDDSDDVFLLSQIAQPSAAPNGAPPRSLAIR